MPYGWGKKTRKQAGVAALFLGIATMAGCGKESPPDVANAPYPYLSSVPDRPRPMAETKRDALMEALESDRLRGAGIGQCVVAIPEAPAQR